MEKDSNVTPDFLNLINEKVRNNNILDENERERIKEPAKKEPILSFGIFNKGET